MAFITSAKTSALCLLVGLSFHALAQEGPAPWAVELSAAKTAFTSGKYDVAVEKYREALQKADEAQAAPTVTLPILRALAASLRTNADPAGAQKILERMLEHDHRGQGVQSIETAPVLSELAVVQRAQDQRLAAITSLRQAMVVRRNARVSEELARDVTLMGALYHEMGEEEMAGNHFQMAISMWNMLPDSGLQILTAIDPLADIRRNQSRYEKAEELYLWVLRLREAALGPKDPELISTLDSLAYVYFGQKKYAEAETMYKRLLEMWEMVGGAEHPMLSLTLDKMAEFYIDQKRYDEAAPISQRASRIRSKGTIETLHRTGRILAGQKKIEEATEVYSRALRIAADAGVPDDEIPGMLRAYSLLLRQKQREKEALAIDKRFKEATERNAEKEGKRPKPEGPQPARPEAQ